MVYEEIRGIPGFKGYFVSPNGDVYSNKSGKMKKLKPFLDSRKKYLLIGLIDDSGQRRKVLIHRIVAICYIPNPNSLPEVNHKDRNTQNPCKENLEWCTRKDNLSDSYETMSPVRNKRQCQLFKGGTFIQEFQSVHQAAVFANQHYGANATSLEKYLQSGDVSIVSEKETERKTKRPTSTGITQNRAPISVVRTSDKTKVGTFKTFLETAQFFQKELGLRVSPKTLQKKYSQKIPINGYMVKRES